VAVKQCTQRGRFASVQIDHVEPDICLLEGPGSVSLPQGRQLLWQSKICLSGHGSVSLDQLYFNVPSSYNRVSE
jgi:hypothetical protein